MSQSVPGSLLNPGNIAKKVFDEDNNAIRVSSPGITDIIIDADSGDNIAIKNSDGSDITVTNPLPVQVSGFNVDKISVDLTAKDNYPNTGDVADSIRIGDGVEELAINPDGSINTKNNLNDGFANPITSSSIQSNRALHTLTPDSVSATSTFNSLNSAVDLELQGLVSIGFQVNSGTLWGRLYAQASVDGGISWTDVNFYDPANSTVLQYLDFATGVNPTKIVSVIPIGGSSHVRVICKNYISGSASGFLRASNVTGAVGSITASAFNTISNTYINLSANTPQLVLPANPNRKYAYISNNSGSTVNIQFATSAGLSAQKGLVIPSQGKYELQGTNLYTGDVYAFSSSAVTISVTEGSP